MGDARKGGPYVPKKKYSRRSQELGQKKEEVKQIASSFCVFFYIHVYKKNIKNLFLQKKNNIYIYIFFAFLKTSFA